MRQVAIEARELAKTYPGGVRALDGVSFTAEQGTVFGLLGPNGAGKSTAVKILTTLARPDTGDGAVAGRGILADPAAVRRSIGVVAQRSGLDGEATGRENLRLQGHLFGLGGRALEDRVDELLHQFGIAEAKDRLVRQWSGGMQRRLDIALALVHRPAVLFCDEPTTGLDPEVRVEMWDEIARLARDGMTVLLTTHYLEEADRLAAKLAIIDRGRIVAAGTPEELKRELHGDAVRLELAEPPDGMVVRSRLDRVAGVRDVHVNGQAVHARADEGASAVPALLAALEASGVQVASVTVARPSLDDVYLRHAGRTFTAAEAETDTSPTERTAR